MSVAPGTAATPPELSAPCLGLSALRLLSVSHNTAALEELERRALSPQGAAALRQSFASLGIPGVLLVTCNRTELYWQARRTPDDLRAEEAFEACARRKPAGNGNDRDPVFRARGEDAARHLFRVACGLESMLLGEHEVMGQVRDARDQAEQVSELGLLLDRTFAAALRTGGRARSETGIGEGALSLASLAVQLLARQGGGLGRMRVLVIGAGATALKVARHLKSEGVGALLLMSRTRGRAQRAAESLGASADPLTELPRRLAEVEGVIAAVHAPRFLLRAGTLEPILRARASRPLAIVDLSVPRAADPSLREIPGVTLYNLFDLEAHLGETRARREGAIPRVEAIIERELHELAAWAHQQAIRPIVAELHQKAESLRRLEVKRAVKEGVLDRASLDRVTRRLVSRLLSAPVTTLRDRALGLDQHHVDYLRRLFDLWREGSR